MDAIVQGEDIEEVSMEATTDDDEPSFATLRGSFVPEGASTLVYKNNHGDLVGPESSAKSVDEYLNCKLCELKFAAVKEAMVHYNGELHKGVLTALAETLGITTTKKPPARRGKRKAPAGGKNKRAKKGSVMMDSGIFVDDNGRLWGAEKNAETLGEFKRCKICSVTASSFKTAKEHYNGNKHIKMLKRRADDEELKYKAMGKKLYTAVAQGAIERDEDPMGLPKDMRTQVHKDAAAEREEKEKETSAVVVVKDSSEEQKENDNEEKPDKESTEAESEQLPSTNSDSKKSNNQIKLNSDVFCWTCMVSLTSKQTADLHYSGKKHTKLLAQQQYGSDVTKHGKPILDLAGSGVPYCTPCDVMCITREQLEEHCEGEKHLAVLKAEEKREQDAKKAVSGDLGYGCRICDVRLNSKQSYLEHLESRKHLKKFHVKEDQKLENRLQYGGFAERYPPFPNHGPWRGPEFHRMGPGGWDEERPWQNQGPPFGRPVPGRRGHGRPGPGRPGPGRWSPGRWEGDGPRDDMGHFPYREDGGGPGPSENKAEGMDFVKAIGSGEELSETILNLLPKEALLKLAIEALTSKSKELVGSGGGGGEEKEGGNWNQDEDYQSYEYGWDEDSGMERGSPGRGRGRGFDGGRGGRGFDGGRRGGGFDGGRGGRGGRDRWDEGYGRFGDQEWGFDSHMERGRGRGFGRGFGRGLGRARGGWGY